MDPTEIWRLLARALLGEPAFTPADVGLQAGVDMEQARRLWRALGFPPVPDGEQAFTRWDADMLAATRNFVASGATEQESLVQLTRVTGQSLARLADAQTATIHDASPEQMVEWIDARVPQLERFLAYAWRRHLLAALFRAAAANAAPTTADGKVVIGFADMVGFTELTQQLSDGELSTLVDRFEAVAYEHIPERGGRIVKTIGDEVMFAVESPSVAAEIALTLVAAYAADDLLPDVRVGMAFGPVVSSEGDLFGPTVNLANRLAASARPGTALISEDLQKELAERPEYTLRPLPVLKLKGIGSVHAWALRRPEPPAPEKPKRRRRRDKAE